MSRLMKLSILTYSRQTNGKPVNLTSNYQLYISRQHPTTKRFIRFSHFLAILKHHITLHNQ